LFTTRLSAKPTLKKQKELKEAVHVAVKLGFTVMQMINESGIK